MGVLEVGVLNVGSKPFTPQGEAGSWEFLPNCVELCVGGGGVCGESLSQPFLSLSRWTFVYLLNV